MQRKTLRLRVSAFEKITKTQSHKDAEQFLNLLIS